jgi:hypothetical protein
LNESERKCRSPARSKKHKIFIFTRKIKNLFDEEFHRK